MLKNIDKVSNLFAAHIRIFCNYKYLMDGHTNFTGSRLTYLSVHRSPHSYFSSPRKFIPNDLNLSIF